jgi:hypothetical protein
VLSRLEHDQCAPSSIRVVEDPALGAVLLAHDLLA